MSTTDLKAAYRTILADHFAPRMEISFIGDAGRQTLCYEKVEWTIDGESKGLRYGENPGQEAALYKLVNGNLALGDVEMLQPGRYLASVPELLQSGKHPGKTNITDTDNALNILRYLMDKPCAAIVKHNNPCGVAIADSLPDAYFRANKADRLAAFGGAIALNRECDLETAKLIGENYAEVVAAPEFAPGVMDLFATKKNLRVFRIRNMARLADFVAKHVVDFKSLIDGGIVAQTSFSANARKPSDLLPATCTRKITDKATGAVSFEEHTIQRLPTEEEYEDLIFGWLVEAGVTSNSVLYVKDGVTVGIGTGEQDRVGVAEIARDKAYTKHADWIAWEKFRLPYNDLRLKFGEEDGARKQAGIMEQTRAEKGGLPGCAMVSDAFFPFRDGAEVGIREGITSIVQPGGAIRDWDVIDCCNEAGVAMVFTGQRSFKH
ncbi:MAG: IMP cyclohydrolase [Kiritimatiellia bacterium]|jgi:phosphoribosylaminoimidazolecarboxamide formyltransferase/IMP cyclohydrolase